MSHQTKQEYLLSIHGHYRRVKVTEEWSHTVQTTEEKAMDSNLEKTRTRATLLLASERLRELLEFLENGIPGLIADVEQLRLELAEMKAQQRGYRPPTSSALQRAVENPKEKPLLSSKEFAFALGVKESTVRKWTLMRKIKVVKVGRSVRIPRAEVVRIMDEGTIPVRPSRI